MANQQNDAGRCGDAPTDKADVPESAWRVFDAMAQGKVDYTVPVDCIQSDTHGPMMAIMAQEGVIYITREQAMAFFGLAEKLGDPAVNRTQPSTSWRKGGTTTFGDWRQGEEVTSLERLKIGDVLWIDSQQFDAINLAQITGRSKFDADNCIHARFVDPNDVRAPRAGSNPEGFAIWAFELGCNPDGRPKFSMAYKTP
jgi:hypothetical protein